MKIDMFIRFCVHLFCIKPNLMLILDMFIQIKVDQGPLNFFSSYFPMTISNIKTSNRNMRSLRKYYCAAPKTILFQSNAKYCPNHNPL